MFTDQGVVNERTVGKPVAQRTVIRIENNDRHVYELYFTPPEGKEQLADRSVYTRVGSPERRGSARSDATRPIRHGIALPSLPDPDPGETGPYCLIAKHRARPGLADAYEKRMLADLERTRAETGAFQFYIHRDRFDRNLFVIYEVWRDVKALREHFEEPYVLQFVADSAQYIEGNMEVQWLVMAGDRRRKRVSRLPGPGDQAIDASDAGRDHRSLRRPGRASSRRAAGAGAEAGRGPDPDALRGRELHRRDDACWHRRGREALSRHRRLGPGGNGGRARRGRHPLPRGRRRLRHASLPRPGRGLRRIRHGARARARAQAGRRGRCQARRAPR